MKILTRVLLVFLSLILTLLLVVTTVSSSLISCVRVQFTPRYVYNAMSDIDYASLEVPDGNGNTAPLCDIINNQARDFGIYFTEDDLNSLIHEFSIDAVLTAYIQDIRSWALDDGPVPVLDAKETASAIISGLDQSLYMILSMFGDPEQTLADALRGIVSAVNTSRVFEEGEMLPKILAFDFMIFIISNSAVIFLLLLITRRLRLVPTAIFTGFACMISGAAMYFIHPITTAVLRISGSPGIMDSVPGFVADGVYFPLVEISQRTGIVIALGGLAAVVVFAVIGKFSSMIEREKAAARVFSAEHYALYQQFDGMPQNFDPVNPMADAHMPISDHSAESPDPSGTDSLKSDHHNDTEY